jgi:hypothetical protein
MPHAANAIALEQDRRRVPGRLACPASFAHDRNQPIAQDLRAAANVMAAAQEIGGLRDGEGDKRHRVGVVGIIYDIRRERELDRFVVAEQALQRVAER